MKFAELFRPIFPHLAGLYFFESRGESSFQFPWDDEQLRERYLAAPIATESNNDFIFNSTVLIDNASIVDEDWNAISLLDSTDFETHRKFESQRFALRENPKTKLVDHRIVFFHNYDGAFWQFFTNIDDVTNSMLSSHATSVDADLRLVNIREHYWNVGRYRIDYPKPA